MPQGELITFGIGQVVSEFFDITTGRSNSLHRLGTRLDFSITVIETQWFSSALEHSVLLSLVFLVTFRLGL